jgi:hypothetical protein
MPPQRPSLNRRFSPEHVGDRQLGVYRSLTHVEQWVEGHDYAAYEPFDGLSSPWNKLTCGRLLLDRLFLQAVRQSPLNIRPLLGIKPLPSTKGRGYMAAGYLSMYGVTADPEYRRKAVACFRWLQQHKSPKFSEYSWANHFDFASRAGRYSKDESIIVWTALIGQAFIDGYEAIGYSEYLAVAESACRWILGLPRERTSSGTCLSYHALSQESIHNANMLGAALLARTWQHTSNDAYLRVAEDAMRYSCSRQRADGSWWYAEPSTYHWIDNFHTGYNLDSVKCYVDATGDDTYRDAMVRGLAFYKAHFFGTDGCPRYYHDRTRPIDSQCAAQAIETLANFSVHDDESLELAAKVADWTIAHMQDRDGHFYYRLYPGLKAKAPMMHWAQATMYKALSLLLVKLHDRDVQPLTAPTTAATA